MKTKLLIALIAITAAICGALGFAACGDNENSEHTEHIYDCEVANWKYLKSEATCSQRAVYYYSCKCGEKGEETFEYGSFGNHIFKSYKYNSDETCTKNGTETAKCENCDKIDTREVPYTKGHIFSNYVSDNNATCTTNCTETAKCERCGETNTREIAESKLGHSFINYVSDNNATCTKNGTETAKCERCDETITREIEFSKHTLVDGICEVCGKGYENGFTYELASDKQSYILISGADAAKKNIEIIIPDTFKNLPVTSIGENAFYWRSSLISITIPDSVTTIGYGAFSGCSSLTSIAIGNGVTIIGAETFKNCWSLTSITIPDNVIRIGSSAFSGCKKLIEKENGVNYVDKWIIDCDTSVAEVTLRSNTKGIANGAFAGCGSLTSVVIPDSVTTISSEAFSGCSSLTETKFKDMASYCQINGLRYINQSKVYIDGQKLTEMTSIVIPDGVTSIGERAFYGCNALISITIGNGVTSIGRMAFSDCTSLEEIKFKDMASYCQIDGLGQLHKNNVFVGGQKLTEMTSIVIPNGVTGIGYRAFYDCESLTSVTIDNGVVSIGEDAFACSSLESIIIPDSVTSVGERAFNSCRSLTSVTIGNGVTSIDLYAFAYCSSLTSVSLPDSVTSIGGLEFHDCNSLIEITFKGTKAQWNAITKGSWWNDGTGNYTIHCTDGDLSKYG